MTNAILLPTNYFMLHNASNLDFAYVFFKWKVHIQRSIEKIAPQVWFCICSGKASSANYRL